MRLFLLIFTLLASPAIAMDQTPFLKIQSAQAAASVGANGEGRRRGPKAGMLNRQRSCTSFDVSAKKIDQVN